MFDVPLFQPDVKRRLAFAGVATLAITVEGRVKSSKSRGQRGSASKAFKSRFVQYIIIVYLCKY